MQLMYDKRYGLILNMLEYNSVSLERNGLKMPPQETRIGKKILSRKFGHNPAEFYRLYMIGKADIFFS